MEVDKWIKQKTKELNIKISKQEYIISFIIFGIVIMIVFIISMIVYIILKDINSKERAIKIHKRRVPEFYSIEFPEKLFPPQEEYSYEYIKRIETGYEQMKKYSIVIVGMSRNNEETIVENIRKIEKIGNYFEKYHILIFENDSYDDTRNKIKMIAGNSSNIELLSCNEQEECKLGIEEIKTMNSENLKKLCSLRNRYLNHVKSKYSKYDYLMVG